MKRYLILIVLLGMTAQGVATNGIGALSSSVSVEDVHLLLSGSGEGRYLQFKIRNDSGERLILLSVKSEYFQSASIRARVSAGEWVEAGSITILADTTLDLGSSHLRVVIERLESKLPANATIPVELVFNRGSVTVDAHVTKP